MALVPARKYLRHFLLAVVFLAAAWNLNRPAITSAIGDAAAQSVPVEETSSLPVLRDMAKYLEGVVVKRLSATEIDPATSHQHEITGVRELRRLFGTNELRLRGRLLYYGEKVFSTDADLTWYDASKGDTPRWRLYYRANPVIKAAKPGDSLVVARYGEDGVLMIVTPAETKHEAEVFSLLKVKGAAALAGDDETQKAEKAIGEQLRQTGRAPVEVSIWKDVDTGETGIEGKVTKVKDGDTLSVSGVFDIRLLGIDAPEHNQTCKVDGKTWHCGEEATKYLTSLSFGKQISCVNKKKEKYGRFLSVCKVDGVDINRAMVEEGLAIIYYSDEYADAEREARQALRGLWNSEFINPEDFRHGKHE